MTEHKHKALVVDLSNVWNRYLFARKGDFSQTVGSILHLFKSIYQAKQFMKVYIVLDGKPCEKYDEFKEYKKNRKHNPDKYIPMKVLSSVLCQYFTVVGGKRVEGDDVVAYIAKRLTKNYDTYIFSNDKDFLQLMQFGVKIVTQFKKGLIECVTTEEEALAKFKNNQGTPLKELKHILPYRVFKGDSSDGIPPAIHGLYDKYIREFIENYWIYDKEFSEDLLMTMIGGVKDSGLRSKLTLNINNIMRNWMLTNLSYIPDDFKSNIQKVWYKLDVNGLSEYVDGEGMYKW